MSIATRTDTTGATGLEPATSGATGQFERRALSDNRPAIARFVRSCATPRPADRMIPPGGSPDVCCPFAARRAARPSSVAGSQLGERRLRGEDSDAVVFAEREEVLAVAGRENFDSRLDRAAEDRIVHRVAGGRRS